LICNRHSNKASNKAHDSEFGGFVNNEIKFVKGVQKYRVGD